MSVFENGSPWRRVAACTPWLALLAVLIVDYWFLCDDAFIYFRYARNLMEGQGLVYNIGERVEGSTSLLWTLELAALWRWFGVRPESASLALSVACTVATVALTVWYAGRTPSAGRWARVWLAAGLLSASTSFAAWSTGGLDTRQFTFLIVLGYVLLTSDTRPRLAPFAGSFVLGLAFLTRPEGLLFGTVGLTWYGVTLRSEPKTLRRFLVVAAPFACIAACLFWFRLSYFGEWFPNSYYAKNVRPWFDAGLRFALAAVLDTGLFVQIPLAITAALLLARTPRGRLYILTLACFVLHMFFVVRMGGDLFEYRVVDPYLPLLAIAAADGIVAVTRRVPLAIPVGIVAIAYSASLQCSMAWLTRHVDTREEATALFVELDRDSAPWLSWLPFATNLAEASNRMRRENVDHLVGQTVREHAAFGRWRFLTWRPYERLERGVLPSDAVTAVFAAGAMPFYLPDLTVIDKLGLCDSVIARTPVTTPNERRILVHDRRPPPGYLEARGVNLTVHPPIGSEQAALDRAGFAIPVATDLWMPFDSSRPSWVQKAFARAGLVRRAPLRFEATTDGVTVDAGRVTLTWTTPSEAGRRYVALSSFGPGPFRYKGKSIPLTPDILLDLSANPSLGAIFSDFAGVVDEQGRVKATIALPYHRALRGLAVHTAIVTLEDDSPRTVSPRFTFEIR